MSTAQMPAQLDPLKARAMNHEEKVRNAIADLTAANADVEAAQAGLEDARKRIQQASENHTHAENRLAQTLHAVAGSNTAVVIKGGSVQYKEVDGHLVIEPFTTRVLDEK